MKNEENILQQRNIKPTAMRLLVIEKLLKQQYAISHKELAEQFENADNVTLFRTLKTFLEHKLIHTIDDGTGVVADADISAFVASVNMSSQSRSTALFQR